MKTFCKVFWKVILLAAAVYAALFAVFFFDLDGKALFRFVEPMLVKHYDKMERRDPLSVGYDIKNKE